MAEGRVRLFEDESLMDALAAALDRHGVKLTGFVVMSMLERHADALERMRGRLPIEFEVHSFSHDQTNACSREEIERSVETYRRHWGESPRGYRAPNGLIDPGGVADTTRASSPRSGSMNTATITFAFRASRFA
jgi:peptidoglycan/xylan/chitin deacetylase (PgdA/CDA1 family)